MPGMLDGLFDPSTFNGSQTPSWLAGAQIPAGMLATNGSTPAPEPQGGDTLPANSTPAQGPAPPADEPPVPGSSLLGRIANVLGKNSNMLMSMGAGFAGAPSFGQGMSRAFAAGPQGHKEDVAQQAYMGGIGATYQALVAAGAQPHEALAAVYNPDILKQISKKYFPGVDVSWQGGVPYNATTGQPVAQGSGELVTIKGPDGIERSAIRRGGQVSLLDPQTLPTQNPTGNAPIRVGSFEDALRLPPGTVFMTPDGRVKTRPPFQQPAAPQNPAWSNAQPPTSAASLMPPGGQ